VKTSTHLTLETLAHGLRFRARTGKGFDLVLDSGEGSIAADPVEATLSALGACHAMDVISILRKKRLDVTGYEVVLSGERRTEHPRAFLSIEVVHRVRGRGVPLAAVEEAARLSDEKYCSVHHSMHPGIVYTSRCEVVEETTGAS
jgi:putative redox protein